MELSLCVGSGRMLGSGELMLRGVSPVLCLLALAAAPSARAADGLRGTLGATTDYIHRGVSQSDGKPVPQGSIYYWHPTGRYAGLWASGVRTVTYAASPNYPYAMDATSHASVEVDLSAGYGKRLDADWVLDFRGTAYTYLNDAAPVSYDYLEFSVAAAWRERIYASLAFTPRTTWRARTNGARSRAAVDAEVAMQIPMTRWITGSVGVGYSELDAVGPSGYAYASASVSLQLHRVSVELGVYATDSRGRELFGERVAGERTALTATVSF